jgi:hypothetical protein
MPSKSDDPYNDIEERPFKFLAYDSHDQLRAHLEWTPDKGGVIRDGKSVVGCTEHQSDAWETAYYLMRGPWRSKHARAQAILERAFARVERVNL